SPAGVRCTADHSSPDDHFTASPHCRVLGSWEGRVGRAGGPPTVRARVVSAPGVEIIDAIVSAPNYHFTASPDSCVPVSAGGRVGRASGRPTIRAGVISPAGVQIAATTSTPDYHFTASPHCRVKLSGSGSVGERGWSPGVIGAATRGTSYYRKCVVRAHCRHRHWPLRFRFSTMRRRHRCRYKIAVAKDGSQLLH